MDWRDNKAFVEHAFAGKGIPDKWEDSEDGTVSELHAAWLASARHHLEKAAERCEAERDNYDEHTHGTMACEYCATGIRALIPKETP